MLDSPEGICAGQVRFEYPATSVPFSSPNGLEPGEHCPLTPGDPSGVLPPWREPLRDYLCASTWRLTAVRSCVCAGRCGPSGAKLGVLMQGCRTPETCLASLCCQLPRLMVIVRSSDADQNCSVDMSFRADRPRSSNVPGSREGRPATGRSSALDGDLASTG
jgi:hypothetical protein